MSRLPLIAIAALALATPVPAQTVDEVLSAPPPSGETRGFRIAPAKNAAADSDKLPNVIFQPGSRPAFKLTEPQVVAFDGNGRPQFTMDAAYLRKLTDGAAPEVLEWNPRDRTIRVTEGASAVWFRCLAADVDGLACSGTRLRVTADGTILVSKIVTATTSRGAAPTSSARPGSAMPGLGARGIPNCPGDPRCPKL